jgi:hypothetical protein
MAGSVLNPRGRFGNYHNFFSENSIDFKETWDLL